MHLSVKGKQLDVGDALRTHVDESLTAIVGKYFGRPIEANVVFSREAHLFKADISVHVGRNILLQSNAEASEPYQLSIRLPTRSPSACAATSAA